MSISTDGIPAKAVCVVPKIRIIENIMGSTIFARNVHQSINGILFQYTGLSSLFLKPQSNLVNIVLVDYWNDVNHVSSHIMINWYFVKIERIIFESN